MARLSGFYADLHKKAQNWLKLFMQLPVWMSALLLACALSSSLSGSGKYLNQFFFFNPVYKLRASTGNLQKLDPRIKLVLVEDGSMQKLGRFPTLSDWNDAAQQLFEIGVEKVFLLGLLNLESEVGKLNITEKKKGEFIAGAVRNDLGKNLRTVQYSEIPPRLLLDTKDATNSNLTEVDYVITQHSSSYDIFDRIGHLNVRDNNSLDIAYGAGPGHVLVNLPLLIMDKLSWRDGKLFSGDKQIPSSSDKTMMIDFVDPQSVLQSSLPVSVFFKKDNGVYTGIADKMSGKLQDSLVGIKYVVFIKEAYQGTRFIESPFGSVPSYYSIISPMNSSLRGHFVYRPIDEATIVFAMIPALVLLLCLRNIQFALIGTLALIVGIFVGSGWLMIAKGWVFPAAEMSVIGLIGWLSRLFHYTLHILQEKLTLNRDLEMGRTVQGLFLPGSLRGKIAGWEFKFLFQPYGAMSGDWVHVYQSPAHLERPFGVFAIGDVVGKGPSAALNTAVIAGIWHHFTEEWDRGNFSMEEFIKQLNRIIRQTFRSNQNTTISIAYVCGDEVTVASCGAPTWIRVHPGNSAGSVRSAPYDPIGLQPADVAVKAVTISPQMGEVFLAHTDGVMEGSKIRKAFLKAMTQFPDGDTEKVFDGLEKVARELGQDEVLPDDFTMLMIRRVDAAAQVSPTSNTSLAA